MVNMTTTLFNTNTNQLLGKFRQGWYLVDGVRPQLEDHIVELVVTATEPPLITDEVTQYLTSAWEADLVEMQWKQVWTIQSRTEEEVIQYITQQGEAAIQAVKQQLSDLILDESYTEKVAEISLLSDEDAYDLAAMFPPFNPSGHSYSTGDRFYYPIDGKLYKVISAGHTSQPDHLPNTAHSLYAEVPAPGTAPEWSSFESWQFASMDIGTAVTDNGTIYYLINPSQGHWQPSGDAGHYGWSTTPPE
jgi:hypothetical protein